MKEICRWTIVYLSGEVETVEAPGRESARDLGRRETIIGVFPAHVVRREGAYSNAPLSILSTFP